MKMYLNSIKTQFSLSLQQQSTRVAVLCLLYECAPGHAECQAHGWLAAWMTEWTSTVDAGSEWESERSKSRGEQRDVRAAAGDDFLHNGWRGIGVRARGHDGGLGWDGLGWGLSRAECQLRPQGTLTQRAIDTGTLCGLDCGPLATGARAPATKTDRKRLKMKDKKEGEPSIHPCLAFSLHLPLTLQTALHFPPDLTTVTDRKWMLLNIWWCKILNI